MLGAVQAAYHAGGIGIGMARYKKLTVPEEILVKLDDEKFAVGFRWLLAAILSLGPSPTIVSPGCAP